MQHCKRAAEAYIKAYDTKHAPKGEWMHTSAAILRDMEYAFAYLVTRESDAVKLRQTWYTQVGLAAMAQRHGCMSGVTVDIYTVEVDLHDAVYSAPKHYASIYRAGNFIGAVDNVQQLLAWLLATHW